MNSQWEWGRLGTERFFFFVWDERQRATTIYDILDSAQSGPEKDAKDGIEGGGADLTSEESIGGGPAPEEKNGETSPVRAKPLAVLPEMRLKQLYLDETGYCYFLANEKIYRWDMTNGNLKFVFDLAKNGISSGDGMMMGMDSNGSLLLYDAGEQADAMYVLSSTPIEEVELTVVNTWPMESDQKGDVLKRLAIEYSRKMPGVTISYEAVNYKERDAYMNRLMPEILAGRGPDIIMLQPEEMRTLWEKGALADLSGLISEETKALLWKAQMDVGQIGGEGKLAGVALDGTAESCLVNAEMWDKDTWTIGELTDLLEKGMEDEDFYGINMGYDMEIEFVFRYMVLSDLEHSPFVDLEAGKSYFNGEAFRHTLEVFQRLGERMEKDTHQERIASGKYLTEYFRAIGFLEFSREMASVEGKARLIGFPSEEGSGNYFYVYSVVTVNAASEKQKAISDFLNTILGQGKKTQNRYGLIRKDILQSYVVENYFGDGKPYFCYDNADYSLLEYKPDNTSYLTDYIDWMESCTAYPTKWDKVREIVEEEIQSYFQQEQSVETVAERIHNRVQLYLDEQS